MASDLKVTFDNAEAVAAALAAAARDFDTMTDAHRKAADIAQRAVATRAPRRTGRLAASIRSTAKPGEFTVSSPLSYAPFVEYGTSRTPAVGFTRGGIEQSRPRWLGVFNDELDKICQRTERTTA